MENRPDSMGLGARIVEALRANPNQKAAELASALGVDRKEVNFLLFGALRGQCEQDAEYRWKPIFSNVPPTADSKSEPENTPLARLCRYYLACVGFDDTAGVSTFAADKFDNLDYCELKELPRPGSTEIFHSVGAQKVLGKLRQDKAGSVMYMGFPVSTKKVTSKTSDWVGFMVEPIILYPVEIDAMAVPRIASTFPLINLAALRRLTKAQRDAVMDELTQLEEELGLTTEGELPEMDELLQRLAVVRPEWPWTEPVDPYDLGNGAPLNEIKETGIFNRAVLIISDRSPFTQGLETELKSLSQLPAATYAGTALGQWVSGAFPSVSSVSGPALIEVLPLNLEQRQAIETAFASPLTIITGPPGTGKSQVVGNLLINAAWQGKRVLFASKNNKAVDVVEIRLNALGPRPIVLRVGANKYQTKLAEYLMGLLASKTGPEDHAEFDETLQRHRAFEEKLLALAKEESSTIDHRNRVDLLEQQVEDARKIFSHTAFVGLRKLDSSRVTTDVAKFQQALKGTLRSEQSLLRRIVWPLIRKARFEALAAVATSLQWVWTSLTLSPPSTAPHDESRDLWTAFSKALDLRLTISVKVGSYFSALAALQSSPSLEEVAHERQRLAHAMSENAEALWNCWLKLQPSRLSADDRKLLARYNAVLKMVVDTGQDGKLEPHIARKYRDFFPQVSHLLPCWAVTSLSAKGRIPFEPATFDLVVFDEASQCDIASALPLLYRAKAAAVIGDPQQLPHISGIQKGQDQQLLAKYDLLEEYPHWAFSCTSLFDLACGFVSTEGIVALRDHHRSHSDIIQFSNDYFYQGRLRVATPYDRLNRPDPKSPGVRWVQVSGNVDRPQSGGAVNRPEAQAVLSELRQLVVERGYLGTVGVVSPFRAQANLISELVLQDTALSQKLQSAEFLVDTVHKFQGDERDVMIFSPVVSRNTPTGALLFLKKNGNLFNVAITRAKAMLVVVGDKVAAGRSEVEYLAAFEKYVHGIETSTTQKFDPEVSIPGPEYPAVSNPEQVSDWERFLYRELYKAGVPTLPQYALEKYRLDLAIVNGDRRLDIEVDGERYHRRWTGELCRRDQIRNQRMYELGWDVIRFWVYEVRDDLGGCIRRVKEWQLRKSNSD